jgi:hypothetical protein
LRPELLAAYPDRDVYLANYENRTLQLLERRSVGAQPAASAPPP